MLCLPTRSLILSSTRTYARSLDPAFAMFDVWHSAFSSRNRFAPSVQNVKQPSHTKTSNYRDHDHITGKCKENTRKYHSTTVATNDYHSNVTSYQSFFTISKTTTHIKPSNMALENSNTSHSQSLHKPRKFMTIRAKVPVCQSKVGKTTFTISCF